MSDQVTVTCQRYEIHNGGMVYPYFLGALPARELKKVSDAPSFGYDTPNHQIAADVLVPPTKHWQRPLKEEKVRAIAERFDLPAEIMPNPVLLAVNPDRQIVLNRDIDAHGIQTGLWTIKIDIPDNDQEQKPLWIIDGQHRVMGMAETVLSNSPLPFVLLYSEQEAYIPGVLAKIFAQVTTEATPLNKIHQAWMQFVFKLGEYEEGTSTWKAMKSTALLCRTQLYKGITNPFYGKIGFNPELPAQSINPNGFSFDAKYFQDLLETWYFDKQGGEYSLTEEEVAEQIALAVHALKGVIKREVEKSAFFGDSRSEQKYFRDGFIAGVCSYLLENGVPREWSQVLKDLKFPQTDWDVSVWVNSTGGLAGNTSKKLAFSCFEDVFGRGELPEGVESLCTYLQGQGAFLQLEYRLVDENDTPIRNSTQVLEIELSTTLRQIVIPAKARYIKITSPCINVGPVHISLKSAPYDERYSFGAFKRGRVFPLQEMKQLKNKIELEVKADFYGELSLSKKLVINVRD